MPRAFRSNSARFHGQRVAGAKGVVSTITYPRARRRWLYPENGWTKECIFELALCVLCCCSHRLPSWPHARSTKVNKHHKANAVIGAFESTIRLSKLATGCEKLLTCFDRGAHQEKTFADVVENHKIGMHIFRVAALHWLATRRANSIYPQFKEEGFGRQLLQRLRRSHTTPGS